MLTEETKVNVLKVSDRCDACGSQAFVWINGVNGDLMFCGHHFTKYEEKLREYAFEVIDERDSI